jgi:hypothetical protein
LERLTLAVTSGKSSLASITVPTVVLVDELLDQGVHDLVVLFKNYSGSKGLGQVFDFYDELIRDHLWSNVGHQERRTSASLFFLFLFNLCTEVEKSLVDLR